MGVSLSERQQKKDVLRAAAMLHDIGKAAIPRNILAKQEQYNEEERQIMYRHTIIGARLFTRQGHTVGQTLLRGCTQSPRTLGWLRLPRQRGRHICRVHNLRPG